MKKQEFAVPKVSDLKDGEMREVSAGETKILLARVRGKYHAVGAHCTHYGAPLAEGFLDGERIVCPWHHACFDITTGDLEEPPAFDSLPCFELKIKGEEVLVCLPENVMDRRIPPMIKRDMADKRQFVIIGGGAAGFMAAQALREEGFAGRILLFSRDDRLPYDRPNLSKDFLQGHAEPAWMPLRSEEFFAEHEIEIFLEKEAVKVDAAAQEITFKDGKVLEYDSLLIATGSTPRRLPFQFKTQNNVFLLRSFADSNAIINAAEKGKRAVVIGASFIGMETASSLRVRGCEVTVVAPDKVPFEKTLGAEIGGLFQKIHEGKSVKFKLGAQVKGFEGDGPVEAVLLENGERIEADFVVVGIGVKSAADFLEGVKRHEDGGVIADEFLRIADNLYAAGDIVHFPDSRFGGELTRIEHWRTALQQGRTAARNMAGASESFTAVPFFWTTQFDATLTYVGHVKNWDRIIIRGDVEKQDFLAFYVKDDKIRAVAGMNRDRELAEYEEKLRLNQMPQPGQFNQISAPPQKAFRRFTGLF